MNSVKPTNEVTVKEMFNNLKDWFGFYLTKLMFISIALVVGAVIGLTISLFQVPEYVAEMTFALEEKGMTSAYAGIASQFGVDLGGEGGAFSGENSMELMKSRTLIEKSLLTPVVIDGEKQLLINRFIAFDEDCREWENNLELSSIKFIPGEARETFSVTKDSLLKYVFRAIRREHLSVNKIDKKLNIIYVKCKAPDELFAKYFAEILVKNVSDFYIETKTKKSRSTVTLLEDRVDSVRSVLDREIYGAAVSRDQNTNTQRAQGSVQSVKKQMNVQVLTTMYGELIKNLELSKFTLMREEPLFQIIDTPVLPLDSQKLRKKVTVPVGGLLAVAITMIYLGLRRRIAEQ